MKLNAILLIAAVVIVTALMWYSNTQKTDTVPIIRGDSSPIKERPDERGGMDIAHSDSTIYDSIRNDNSKQRVENLLAENHQNKPKSREELFAGLKTENTLPPTTEDLNTAEEEQDVTPELKDDENVDNRIAGNVPVDEETAIEAEEKPATPEKTQHATPAARPVNKAAAPATASAPTEKNEFKNLLAEVQGLKTTPIQERKPTAPAPAPKAATTNQQGDHYIQIGSLSSEDKAKTHWANRKKEFAAELGNLQLRIENVEIPNKGTYYRVQAGKVSKAYGAEICSKINAKYAQSCIVK